MTSKSLLAVIPKSVSQAKRALDALDKDIGSAKTYEAIRKIERVADAIKLLFFEIEEIRHKSEQVIVLANHRIGKELAPDARKTNALKGRLKLPSLADQVGSQKRGRRLKQLAALDANHVKRVVAELQDAGKEATVTGVLKAIDDGSKHERRAQREKNLAGKIMKLPDKKYGVIVADPEWRFEPWSRETGMSRAADNHYPTSCTDVIASRNVRSIAADDCVLFLWATGPMMPHALVVMAAWDFDYKAQYVWGKDKIGPGYWNREKHELLLIGTRGKVPCPAQGTQQPSLIMAPRGKHSAKPELFLEMIEHYFPRLPKIELNRRGAPRPGWDAWGAEAIAEAAE
jgi:N6-adenosine-specific RNA methylase IME4